MMGLSGNAAPAANQDFLELELLLGRPIPQDFRAHYSTWNGGMPVRDWFPAQDGREPVWVHEFLPIRPAGSARDESRLSIQDVYQAMASKCLVHGAYLPFASDPGANFFCLDLDDGSVSHHLNDVWDHELSLEDNRAKATRVLAGSFKEFLEALVSEDEAFE